MNWAEANGASLRYALTGTGDATVALVHELGGSLESWDFVLPALERHFRVLRYDQRGFGLSEKAGSLTLDQVLADLDALLDALGIPGPVRLVGTALGAGIALGYAATHPSRVARVVATAPSTGATAARRPQLMARADKVAAEGMRSAAEASLALSYPENLRGDGERYAWYRRRWLTNDPAGFAAVNRMLADMAVDLASVRAPTLVVAGVHDHVRPLPVVRAVADAVSGARYVEADTGHFMAVQTPELFVEIVLPFLKAQ